MRAPSSVLAAALVVLACESGRAPNERPQAAPAAPKPAANVGSRPVFVRGPTNGEPVAPFVAHEVTAAQRGGFNVIVYVGATWCEPCQLFHKAVQAGEFDSLLPGAHLVEFDLDADKKPLADAGYTSELIPLFCVPKTDGTASTRRIEGSIKGPDAVGQNLMPRLRAFLQGS